MKTLDTVLIPRPRPPSRGLCTSHCSHSQYLQTKGLCRCAPWLAELQNRLLAGTGSVSLQNSVPLGDETWLKLTDKSPPPIPEQRGKPDLQGSGPKELGKPFSWVSPFPEPWSLLLPACLRPTSQKSVIFSAAWATLGHPHIRILLH